MTRRLACAVLVLAALTPVADASAAPADRTIGFAKPGGEWSVTHIGALRRAHGVMRLDAARKAFGVPSSQEYLTADEGSNGDPAPCLVRWKRLGLEGFFFTAPRMPRSKARCPGQLNLDTLVVASPAFQTDRGIRVGSNAAAAMRAYPTIGTPEDDTESFAMGDRLALGFARGRVDEIMVVVGAP